MLGCGDSRTIESRRGDSARRLRGASVADGSFHPEKYQRKYPSKAPFSSGSPSAATTRAIYYQNFQTETEGGSTTRDRTSFQLGACQRATTSGRKGNFEGKPAKRTRKSAPRRERHFVPRRAPPASRASRAPRGVHEGALARTPLARHALDARRAPRKRIQNRVRLAVNRRFRVPVR